MNRGLGSRLTKVVLEAAEAIAQSWALERDKRSKVAEPLRCQNFYEAWDALVPEVVFLNL